MQKIVMDKKQRVISIILALVVIVLIWQVVDLFSSSSAPSPTPAAKAPAPAAMNAASSASTATAPTGNIPQITVANTTDNVSPYQKKYLQLLEEYKVVELQKQIAADKQAIATSQAATVEALNKINQLGGVSDLSSMDALDSSTSTTAQKSDTNQAYSLVYTGLQDNDWTATVKQGSNTYDVMVGTVLNGKEKVIDINSNEIVLQDENDTTHLTFDGVTVTPNKPKASVTPAPVAAPTSTTAAVKSSPAFANAQGIVQTPVLPNNKANKPTVSSIAIQQKPAAKETWLETTLHEVADHIHLKKTASNTAVPNAATTNKPVVTPAASAPVKTTDPITNASTASRTTAQAATATAPATSLASLNPEQYTLQLGVLGSKDDLNKFIQELKLDKDYYTYQDKHGRFGVIYGQYATRADASTALKNVPDSWKQAEAYVQKIETVQQSQAKSE
jgi:septal ring-binding cell division protein DamX